MQREDDAAPVFRVTHLLHDDNPNARRIAVAGIFGESTSRVFIVHGHFIDGCNMTGKIEALMKPVITGSSIVDDVVNNATSGLSATGNCVEIFDGTALAFEIFMFWCSNLGAH